MRRIGLLLAVLSAIGILLAVSASAASTSAAGERTSATEMGILSQLNAVRSADGLRPLVISGDLEDAAAAHSRAMLQEGFFEHDSPDGTSFSARLQSFYSPRGFDRWFVGENLLYASDDVTPAEVIDAWMHSPGHRANILTPRWREVGIAAMEAASAPGMFGGRHTFLVTMDFGLRLRRSAATTGPAAKG
jgi:uncharacterized protein YkwD